jgi:hypothetical protein
MVNLQSLNLSHCSSVSDLAPLAAMVNLQSLNMSYCDAVSDLAPLTTVVKLQNLNIRGCSSVSDLAPLEGMVNLKSTDDIARVVAQLTSLSVKNAGVQMSVQAAAIRPPSLEPDLDKQLVHYAALL